MRIAKIKYSVTVSVIIPFYSNVNWLKEAVLSVLNQKFSDYEIIIVNDGSNENINDFLNEFGSKIIYKNKKNEGPASARNIGIELAKGKYLTFLDSDDLWHTDKLKIQVERMEKTGAAWSHTNYETFKNNKKENIEKLYLSDCQGNIFPRSMISALILTSCVMTRADTIKKRSDLRFCESMRFSQDYYLWLLMSYEFRIELITEPLCLFRLRDNNANKRVRVHLKMRNNIWKQFKGRKNEFFFKKWSYFPIRFLYRLCEIEDDFLEKLENKFKLSNKVSEIAARCLYTVPYSLFLILKPLYPIKD